MFIEQTLKNQDFVLNGGLFERQRHKIVYQPVDKTTLFRISIRTGAKLPRGNLELSWYFCNLIKQLQLGIIPKVRQGGQFVLQLTVDSSASQAAVAKGIQLLCLVAERLSGWFVARSDFFSHEQLVQINQSALKLKNQVARWQE